jgi:CheY-like chemotaxis protein
VDAEMSRQPSTLRDSLSADGGTSAAESQRDGHPITQEIEGPSHGVLLVEDDPEVLEALAGLLLDRGFLVLTAANGREALEIITHCRPGVVVLDLMMPAMDGRAVLDIVDRNPSLRTIPVLVMTAGRNTAGIHGRPIFHKPLHVESLLRAIEICIGARTRPAVG